MSFLSEKSVNLSALNDLYPSATGSYGKGDIIADLNVKATAKDYSIEDLVNSEITGKVKLKGIDVNLKRMGVSAWIRDGMIAFGAQANVRDTSIEKGTRITLCELWAKLKREKGYKRKITSLFSVYI